MSKRMAPADRKKSILDAAISEAQRLGYTNFRLTDIAAKAECSTALVMSYYNTMPQVRRAVMRAAIERELLPIIATGVAIKDPYCRKISPDLRERAIASI